MLKKDLSSVSLMKEEDIQKLAKLSRIELKSKDIKEFSKQLSSILDYVNKIQNYKFSAIKSNENQKIPDLRKDEIKKFDGQGIIKQFSEQERKLLRVKKIL